MTKKKTKKTKLWAVVDDGKMEGDSAFSPSTRVEYTPGMTLDDIRQAFAKTEICQDFEIEDEVEIAWVVSQKTLDFVENSMMECHNDSAVYAAVAQMKAMIVSMSIKTITDDGVDEKATYVCKKCKSADIHVAMWANPNTNELMVDGEPLFDYNQAPKNVCVQYCNMCDEECEIIELVKEGS